MAKKTGNGGTITKGGVSIAHVISFDWSESEGEIFGQYQSDVRLDAYLDSASDPIRCGEVADLVLSKVSPDGQNMTITDARVESVSIPVKRGSGVIQSVSFVGRETATIA